ncbi:MAG: monovalent cation/H+ antiporter subunit D family protein [Gammaproteobacteria bacterium]|nr:monovalent cation/H+ antiporter subunit D family protein [Gammaproteobacteria bacterium]
MYQAFIPLLVIAPLFSAPLCLLINSLFWRWLTAVLVAGFSLVAAVLLLLTCLHQGALSYPMGNWPPPIGIEYRLDLLSCYFLVFITLTGFAALAAGRRFIAAEIEPARQGVFIAAYLLLISGLCGIVITGDIFNIFVFLEISSLATYTLIALGRDPRGLVASLRYLLVGTIGTTFFLIGIGLLYAMTGTLNLQDLGVRLDGVPVGRLYQSAIACIVLGTAIKAAVVPFHLWLPPCYAFAPTTVTVFLAAAATKTSLYILYRIGMTVSGWEVFYHQLYAMQALFWSSCFAVVFCAYRALRCQDMRLILAWSSLGQIAYITLLLGLASEAGRKAALVLIVSHALVKSAAFLSLACLTAHAGAVTLTGIRGIGHRRLVPAVVFTVCALGLAGIPLTSGFIAKWYMYQSVASAGQWLALAAIIAASLLGLSYVFRMIAAVWATPTTAPDTPDTASAPDAPSTPSTKLPPSPSPTAVPGLLGTSILVTLSLIIVLLGLIPGPWVDLAARAAALGR